MGQTAYKILRVAHLLLTVVTVLACGSLWWHQRATETGEEVLGHTDASLREFMGILSFRCEYNVPSGTGRVNFAILEYENGKLAKTHALGGWLNTNGGHAGKIVFEWIQEKSGRGTLRSSCRSQESSVTTAGLYELDPKYVSLRAPAIYKDGWVEPIDGYIPLACLSTRENQTGHERWDVMFFGSPIDNITHRRMAVILGVKKIADAASQQ